jgi:predicted nucleotide-binding protein (sugar kinase/HSP70/actin superfamily)
LYDKGTRKRKLPDLAPDPFREREELLQQLIAPLAKARGNPRIALSDEFMLKGLFPFFAAFIHEAGFDLQVVGKANAATLKRGIQSSNVPFCAPMQLFHGLTGQMAEAGADYVFVPMLRSVPRVRGQRCSVVCPVVQAAPDVMRWNHGLTSVRGNFKHTPRILSPIIDFAEGNLESKAFWRSREQLAKVLGLHEDQCRRAWSAGLAAQREFDLSCLQIGRRALEFCLEHDIVPVVVLGRNYTIYNKVLNSNVPAILREQGAIGIPADCFPVDADVPLFPDMYWGFGHDLLRAAHQARRTPGVYALYCSNYSCGPDSFNLHFAAYVMEGKPFASIETDGHSGDAGTKTRVEAFLHCVDEDRRTARTDAQLNDFAAIQSNGMRLGDVQKRNGASEQVLVPYIGPASGAVAAVLRGLGLHAEGIPAPDGESLRRGRRYTSGKECLPMTLTLGSLLQRLDRATERERFVYLMPSTDGPCRFGAYNVLNRIVLERLGWRDRVRIWAPKDTHYFDGFPAGTKILVFAGFVASDLLYQALLDARPVERERGAANALYTRYHDELLSRLEAAGRGDLSLGSALWQVTGGHLFGLCELLERAGADFAAARGPRELPLVELVGEIYVRSVGFSNDSIIEKLEARGLRVQLASKTEWVAYCGQVGRERRGNRLPDRFAALVEHRIEALAAAAIGRRLGWPAPPAIPDILNVAQPYVNAALNGEAVLTVGTPLLAWRRGQIDAVVSVGPLECMPTKIAEAQFHHVSEHEGLLNLTLSFNGDPINTAALDNFAFEVKERYQRRQTSGLNGTRLFSTGSNQEPLRHQSLPV